MNPLVPPLMLALAAIAPPRMDHAINFAHLDHLTERVALGGDKVSIVHIYANYPDYRWVAAAESGPEGIACVDDAARAAVLSLRSYELRGDTASLTRARGLLAFVMLMQAPDGEFYNFIRADHTVNVTGKTSFKSFGWWAARGLWAMAMGGRIFMDRDPQFARMLLGRVSLMIPLVSASLKDYGNTRSVRGYTIPRWLLYESGADVTSELLLGLMEYRKAGGDDSLTSLITKLARGVLVMQDGDLKSPPYGLHRSWETLWHMWGNGQTQALSTAGLMLHDTTMIASAVREARGWYGRLLMHGFLKEYDVAGPAPGEEYEQIAYGVRPMAVGLLRLYDATKDRDYLLMAGLAASWFTGNNPAGQAMYDPATGRCFDGIRDSLTLNLNSGAESTIEALYTLLEVKHYPDAAALLGCRKVAAGTAGRFSYALFRGGREAEVTLVRELATGRLRLYEGKQSRAFCRREKIR
ncbi:MAG TPA: hypothetical protein VF514_00985 [Bacteroidota bacterium]